MRVSAVEDRQGLADGVTVISPVIVRADASLEKEPAGPREAIDLDGETPQVKSGGKQARSAPPNAPAEPLEEGGPNGAKKTRDGGDPKNHIALVRLQHFTMGGEKMALETYVPADSLEEDARPLRYFEEHEDPWRDPDPDPAPVKRRLKFQPQARSGPRKRTGLARRLLDPNNQTNYDTGDKAEEAAKDGESSREHSRGVWPKTAGDGPNHEEMQVDRPCRPVAALDVSSCDLEKCRARLRWCLEQGLGMVDLSHMAIQDQDLASLVPELVQSETQIWILRLNDNDLTTLPSELKNLSRLSVLLVRNNRLRSLPAWIDGCKSLRELDAAHNILEDVPVSLGSLPALSILNLSYNILSSFMDDSHRRAILSALQVLDLSHNSITRVASRLSHAPLSVLDLSNNLLPGLPKAFEKITTLRKFSIAHNPCVSRIPRILARRGKPTAVVSHLAGLH